MNQSQAKGFPPPQTHLNSSVANSSAVTLFDTLGLEANLIGPPIARFRDNLRPDRKYIASCISAGWTNDVMTYINLIYLALITDRIPVIPMFPPFHIGIPSLSLPVQRRPTAPRTPARPLSTRACMRAHSAHELTTQDGATTHRRYGSPSLDLPPCTSNLTHPRLSLSRATDQPRASACALSNRFIPTNVCVIIVSSAKALHSASPSVESAALIASVVFTLQYQDLLSNTKASSSPLLLILFLFFFVPSSNAGPRPAAPSRFSPFIPSALPGLNASHWVPARR
ncbi:hypothetical protein D9615_010039 [Tricholomella constricta]|uniref:Uncharacterized protein n=1 Tax=Tricholomella constricta TaxID=117010 RepID=A0A8H5GTZ4_9AGAR|nr:hypothetical protein D9615_010039 [Tricholomella constricta]